MTPTPETGTAFRKGDDVAVVEHDDDGNPVRDGRIIRGTVTEAGPCSIRVSGLFSLADEPRLFLLDSRNRAWRNSGRWRAVPLCRHCEEPITGEPVTSKGDPLGRTWCGEGCRDADAEQAYEQHYPSGVAT